MDSDESISFFDFGCGTSLPAVVAMEFFDKKFKRGLGFDFNLPAVKSHAQAWNASFRKNVHGPPILGFYSDFLVLLDEEEVINHL